MRIILAGIVALVAVLVVVSRRYTLGPARVA